MIARLKKPLSILLVLLVLASGLYQLPAIHERLAWRLDVGRIYLKNWIRPLGPAPTPLPVTPAARSNPPVASPTPRPVSAVTATPTSLPLPSRTTLPSPAWERQTPNNCGPATLSMALHMYGWEGTQEDIAKVIKPVLQDRNVNPEEMAYYVRNYAGWLNIEFRVAGDLSLLKRLLAAGYPVIIEGVTRLDPNDALGPNDDLWAAHYLLLTGYDDAAETFTVQ
ncbi:MAG: C39 family peptidase, partial [Anaerolineae bacterium]